jgi:hypothetical protein
MDFDEYDEFEDRDEYDDFDDQDSFYDDDIDRDLEDTSGAMGPVETETSRTGLEWYEVGLLGALANELSEEKKRRWRVKDRNNPKRKT